MSFSLALGIHGNPVKTLTSGKPKSSSASCCCCFLSLISFAAIDAVSLDKVGAFRMGIGV